MDGALGCTLGQQHGGGHLSPVLHAVSVAELPLLASTRAISLRHRYGHRETGGLLVRPLAGLSPGPAGVLGPLVVVVGVVLPVHAPLVLVSEGVAAGESGGIVRQAAGGGGDVGSLLNGEALVLSHQPGLSLDVVPALEVLGIGLPVGNLDLDHGSILSVGELVLAASCRHEEW